MYEWRRHFVGRGEELAFLRDAWDDAKGGSPRLVVLLGESGLGKTRLAQEFYRAISSDPEEDPPAQGHPEGYWPDAFVTDQASLDVNPTFERTDAPRPPIPWLWWGLRAEQPEHRNRRGDRCALVQDRHHLRAHVEPIAVARQLKELRRDAVARTAGIGGEVASGFFPILGLLLAACDTVALAQDRSTEKQLRERGQESVGEAMARRQRDLADIALDDFEAILDPDRKDAKTVPVVLLLDDAQWADETTLRFVWRLLARARDGGWPLLVIATHWEKEWEEHLDALPVEQSPPRRFVDIPRLLGLGTDWKGLRELPPIPDLSALVREALPGLTDAQQSRILKKAGGNPLLLEQMLEWLLVQPEFFDDDDASRSLTANAEQVIDEEHFDLHEVIRKRFVSLSLQVKRSLAWSSEQGLRFLPQLTKSAAQHVQATLGDDVDRALKLAEHPHCLIRLQRHGQSPIIGEFRQSAFCDIAQQYLEKNTTDRERIVEIMCELLSNWIETGAILRVTPEERLLTLEIADRLLMTPQYINTWKKASRLRAPSPVPLAREGDRG